MEGKIMEQIVTQKPLIQNESDRYLNEGCDNCFNVDRAEKRGEARGEAESKLEVARAMLAESMPIELISKITGLTIEELKILQKG
jgi:predicted transposase/invertase (TIGR01784 family)